MKKGNPNQLCLQKDNILDLYSSIFGSRITNEFIIKTKQK